MNHHYPDCQGGPDCECDALDEGTGVNCSNCGEFTYAEIFVEANPSYCQPSHCQCGEPLDLSHIDEAKREGRFNLSEYEYSE